MDNLEQEYLDVAAQFNRAVAARFLRAKMIEAGRREGFTLRDWYECNADHSTTTDHILPFGTPRDHYRHHPKNTYSNLYAVTRGESAKAFDQLVAMANIFGNGIVFLFADDESVADVREEILSDQGEWITKDDEARFCVWLPGWHGWAHAAANLTPEEDRALELVAQWMIGKQFTHRWPEPGTPEAEAYLETRKDLKTAQRISTNKLG